MLIDHVGFILFPHLIVLRIIGRLSMPLYAYCIARGFYYSEEKGTTMKYARNIFLFAALSQIPYTILSMWVIGDFRLNIGFTWLLSLFLLKSLISEKRPLQLGVMCVLLFLIGLVLPIDYGLYGMIYPTVFYLFMYRIDKPQYSFVGMAILYALYIGMGGGAIQIFSLIAFPTLLLAKKYDEKVKINRLFFYYFYPLHIAALLIIKGLLSFINMTTY